MPEKYTSGVTIPSVDRSIPLVLDCRQLRLRAGHRILIDRLDWQVARGDVWCVLGPNGVGKSTLLYTLAGILQPASGMVCLEGKPLLSWSLTALARMRGLMAQQQSDAFSITALDAVLVGRTPYRTGARESHPDGQAQSDLRIARAALVAAGMDSFTAADVMQLSGGERQRVALATLFAQAPALMLLDEPTSHQDVAHQLAVMQQIRSRSPHHTLILTTHDINLAARFATHVLLLSATGAIAGPAEQVLQASNLRQTFGCDFDVFTHAGASTFVAR